MLGVQTLHIVGQTTAAGSSSQLDPLAIGGMVGFVVLFGLGLYFIARQKKALAALAQKNGWQPLTTDDATLNQYVPAYLRNNSQSQGHGYQMAYKARAGSQDMVFFRYDDTVRDITPFSDNHTSQTISYAIAAFEVPQTFGSLLILHHSRLGNFGKHPELQKFNLEGDFSKYFDVYAPQGSAPETLSVLTPDTMALLIDLGQRSHWSVQIDGHTVIVEGDADLISASKITDLLNYADALRQELAAKPLVKSDYGKHLKGLGS